MRHSQEPGDTDPVTGAPSIPPPLNPTRARGKFAARMAQRRIEQAAAQAAIISEQHEESPDEIEDVERLVDVDMDDDDDDDEEIVRGLDVDVDEFLGSDDSADGEDVGIVMKKHDRWGSDVVGNQKGKEDGEKEARVD
jgi:hypothetical protein